MKRKAVSSFLVALLMFCTLAFTSFADTGTEEAVDVEDVLEVEVGYNSISISGKNTGVELVKTDSDEVSFEFLNADNESAYTNSAIIEDEVMTISVVNSDSRPENISVKPDEYQNTVRVYIPDMSYEQIDIDATDVLVRMQDFNASVNVTGGVQGGLFLADTTISEGTYNVDFETSYVNITADTITSDITVNQKNGLISLSFEEEPTNLYLDTTKCKGIVRLPIGWKTIERIGEETPNIILATNGATYVNVK